MLPARLHASLRRDEPMRTQQATGEIRVPLSLFAVDQNQGEVDLVMSRAEGQRFFTQLAEALGLVNPAMPAQRGLEAVR
ncbi:MAG: hypothetical protein HOV70_01985 [Streptomyces sp.]|nr:hypothetical protein [Streptomyces sp.]